MPSDNLVLIKQLESRYRGLLRQGDLAHALNACEQLAEMNSADPETWYNLGYLRRCFRKFGLALDAYGKAIEYGLKDFEHAHLNRAAIMLDHLADPEAARSELELAVKANSGFAPAWLNLGQLFEDLGERDKAADAYRQVLKIEHHNGRALGRLSRLGALGENAVSALRKALGLVPYPSDDAAELLMAIAHSLEVNGDYAGSFAAMERANSAVWQITPPTRRIDRAVAEASADAMVQAIADASTAAADCATPSPIFIVGMFRSGSTLAERILARHPEIRSLGEAEGIPAIAASLESYPARLESTGNAAFRQLARAYLAEAGYGEADSQVMVDKRPDNFLHLALIFKLFPGARVINTVRNADDTMLSIYGNLFAEGVPYASRLGDIAAWQQVHDRIMQAALARWPNSICQLRYEALVTDPEPQVRKLLEFCGLGWDDRCLDPSGSHEAVRTLSQWQVRQPIHTRSVGRSQPYARFFKEMLVS